MGYDSERSDSEDEHYGGFTGGGKYTLNNDMRKVRHNIVSLFHDEEFRTKITDENKQEFVNIFFYLIQNKKLNPYERYFYEEFYAYHTMEDINIQQITEEDVNQLVEYYEGRLGLKGKSKISFPFHDKKLDVILLLKKGEENETNNETNNAKNEGEEQNNNQETEHQIQGQEMILKKLQKMYAYLNGIVDENYEPSDVDFLDDDCKNTDSMDGKIECIEDKILAKITEINEKKPDNTAEQEPEPEPEPKLDDMKKQILEKLKTGFAGLNINTETENGNNLNAQINTIQRRIKEKFDEIKSKNSDTISNTLQEKPEEVEEVDVYADLNLNSEKISNIKKKERLGGICQQIATKEIDDEETMRKYFGICCENKEKKKQVEFDNSCLVNVSVDEKGKNKYALPNNVKPVSKSNESITLKSVNTTSINKPKMNNDPIAAYMKRRRSQVTGEGTGDSSVYPASATASGDGGIGLMAQIRAAKDKKPAKAAAPAAGPVDLMAQIRQAKEKKDAAARAPSLQELQNEELQKRAEATGTSIDNQRPLVNTLRFKPQEKMIKADKKRRAAMYGNS